MGIKSINEPEGPGRTTMLTPVSINEPPTGENVEEAVDKLTPKITELSPSECTIGDASFTLSVLGTGFTDESKITFAGNDEPTTREGDALTTGVDMDYWHGPDVVPVTVKNGSLVSNTLDFTFHAAPEADAESHQHRGTSKQTLPHKRKR